MNKLLNFKLFEGRKLIWTKEKLQEEANKYKTRSEFDNANHTIYMIAHHKGLMDELFKNHPNKGYVNKKPKATGHWTKETLQDEANKYNNRNEFRKYASGAYDAALTLKIVDKLFKNHYNKGFKDDIIKNKGYWTKEKLQKEADKYESRVEFFKSDGKAYSAAQRLKLLNDIFKNHENDGYLTKDEWKENSYVVYVYEIEEFNSAYVGLTNNMKRRDREHLFSEKEKMSLFCKENDIPYPKYKILEEDLTSSEAQRQEDYWEKSYRNNGWTIFNISRTGSLGNFRKKWTKKALQEEADKYETRFEFQKNSNSAYSTAQRTGLLDELFKNHYNKGLNKKASKENLQKYVDKYETRKEFKKNYPSQYTYAQKTGILDELFKNHPNKGIHQKRWTKERLQEEADKYETRDDFRINSNSAYSTAQRTGLLAELFKNHPNKGFLEIYWTEKRLQEEANKYKTRKEFRKMSKNGYSTAVNKHILDELFKNHPNNGYTKIKN